MKRMGPSCTRPIPLTGHGNTSYHLPRSHLQRHPLSRVAR